MSTRTARRLVEIRVEAKGKGGVMTTPAEVGAAKKAFDWSKNGATYVFRLAKRIATLEERVTELENALKKQPADACPFCGERAMRKTEEGRLLGSNLPGLQQNGTPGRPILTGGAR
jgi:hypothetical protein